MSCLSSACSDLRPGQRDSSRAGLSLSCFILNLSWSHLCLLFAQRVCSPLPRECYGLEENDAEHSNACQPGNRIRRQHSENAEDKQQPEEK
jgi:hypothetical protein